MRRWAFAGVLLVSLVLFVADMGLWFRSYSVADEWMIDRQLPGAGHPMLHCTAVSVGGTVEVMAFRGENDQEIRSSFRHISGPAYPLIFQSFDRTIAERLGFRWSGGTGSDADLAINFPLWFTAGAFALLPAMWLIRAKPWRTKRVGICAVCGYDLRASSGRCPECGTPIPAG